VVGGDAVHIDSLLRDATKEVATSYDDANLASDRMDRCDLLGNLMDKNGINAETSARGQGFAGDL